MLKSSLKEKGGEGNTMPCKKTVVGKTYKAKKWAKRFGKGRPVRKVKGGFKIYPKKRKK